MNLRRLSSRALPLAALGIAGMLAVNGGTGAGTAAMQTDPAVTAREAAASDLKDLVYSGASGGLARIVREAVLESSASPFLQDDTILAKAAAGSEPLSIEAVAGRTRAVSRAAVSDPLIPTRANGPERESSRLTREALVTGSFVDVDIVDRSAARGSLDAADARGRGMAAFVDRLGVASPIIAPEAAARAAFLGWPDEAVTLELTGQEEIPAQAEASTVTEAEQRAIEEAAQSADIVSVTEPITETERQAARQEGSLAIEAALAEAVTPFEREAAREAASLDAEAGAIMTSSPIEREASASTAGSKSLEGLTGGSFVEPEGASGIEREAGESELGAAATGANEAREAGRAALEEAVPGTE